MIFAYFLGMCSFLAVSKNVKTAFGLGIAVTFMLVVTQPINFMLNKYVLQEGALTWLSPALAGVDLSFLGLIIGRDTLGSSVLAQFFLHFKFLTGGLL